MFGLSRWTLIGVGIALALITWLLLGDSDEAKIRERLDELAHAVGSKQEENLAFRALRLKSTFHEGMEANVRLAVPELREATGVQELTQLAASAPRLFGEFDLSIDDAEVTIDEATHQASAVAEVTLTGTSSEIRRDKRRVRFQLVEKDGDWRVSRIDAEAKTTE